MTRDPRPTPGVALLWIAACVAVAHLFAGCASGPQLAAPVVPQQSYITIDASDGGAVTISGDVWLDARGSASSSQQGLDVEADIDANLETSVHP